MSVMFRPPPFHADRPGLVAPVRLDPTGRQGPTRGQARGRRWRTASPGRFVPVDVPLTTGQRIVEAASSLHDGAAVTGWAALHWLGSPWFTGLAGDGATALPVPVVTLRQLRPRPGILVSQEFMAPWEVQLVDGVPVTRPARSAGFEARRASTLVRAVTVLDMTAYSDLADLSEIGSYAAQLGPKTGIGQLRDALPLAEENAWSPMEVEMRELWRGTGRVRPLCNVPIFDLEGRHVATSDLLDVEAGVVGEYEGEVHLVGARRAKDVAREGLLRRHGLEVVTMVAADRARPGDFFRRLDDAYRRAAHRRTDRRSWTTRQPNWWVPTETVAQRRALSERQRASLLRYRVAS